MGFSPCFVMQYLVSFLVLYLSILAERVNLIRLFLCDNALNTLESLHAN